jgi:hypothetical protein
MRARVVVPVAALALLLAGAPATRADTVLGSAACSPTGDVGCSGLSGYGGMLVWTSFDAGAKLYRLWAIAAPGGAPAALPVAGRRAPFNADAGPDATGAPVAVYARCAGDPGGPRRGCGLFEFDPARGRESRLLEAVAVPAPATASIWRNRIAFSGARSADGLRHPTICTLGRRSSCRTLPAGPPSARPSRPGEAVQRLDLHGRALAFSWYSVPRSRQTRILLIRDVRKPGRAPVQVAKAGAGGAGDAAVFSPAIDAGALYYGRGGATCEFGSPPNRVGRYHLATATRRELPSAPAHAVAPWNGALAIERCGQPESSIVALDPDPFAAAPPPLVPKACPAPSAHATGWSRPATLSGTDANAGLAARADGTLAVLAGSRGSIRVRLRRPGQRAFGPPERIGKGNVYGAQLAFAGDGRLIVLWQHGDAVRAAVSDARLRFGAGHTLDRVRALRLRLAVGADGTAVAAWHTWTSVAAATRPAGGDFGATQQVWQAPAGGGSIRSLAAGVDGQGGGLLAWVPVASSGRLLVSTSVAAGAFTAPAPLAAANAGVRQVAVALGVSGDGVVAWIDRSGHGQRVAAVRRLPDGTLGPAFDLSTARAPVASTPPVAVAAHGAALVAWNESEDRASRIATATITPSSIAREPLTAYTSATARIEAALDDRGDAAIAWAMRCGSYSGRVVVAVRRSGSRFGTARAVSGPDTGLQLTDSPHLALDGSAHAAVVWDRYTPTTPLVTRFAETVR